MDLRHLVSSDLDVNLKCFICKNYLSYFPISLCSNNESICGRCTAPENVTYYKDKAFETLCKFVKFPCRYHLDGCIEELVPEDVPQHEQTCQFRNTNCVLTDCDWSGALLTLLQHCRDVHSDMFLEGGEFELDMSVSEEKKHFLDHNDGLVIFIKKFDSDSKKLAFSLRHKVNGVVDTTSSLLTLKCGKMNFSYELNLTSYDLDTFTELCLGFFCAEKNDGNLVFGKVDMGEMRTVDDTCQPIYNEDNSDILAILKCGTCRKLGRPPFYRDLSGSLQIFCSKCKRDSKISLKERQRYEEDEDLCQIVDKIHYQCLNGKNGCTYTAKYDEMRSHYELCQYENQRCFLMNSCDWIGPVIDTLDHICDKHGNLFIPSGVETDMTCYPRRIVRCKVIKINNFFFKLCYVKKEERFMWSVQTMENYKEKFKYQIDVSCKGGGRLSLRQFCAPITKQDSVFLSPDQYCYLYGDQLYMLRCEDRNNYKFVFKVKVFK